MRLTIIHSLATTHPKHIAEYSSEVHNRRLMVTPLTACDDDLLRVAGTQKDVRDENILGGITAVEPRGRVKKWLVPRATQIKLLTCS